MKVITFSHKFPQTHPRRGEHTLFIEKIYEGIHVDFDFKAPLKELRYINTDLVVDPKYHTIRAGQRWNVGDKFSPRIWSGKPYQSKQIAFAQPVEIKKTWTFRCEKDGTFYLNEKRIDVTSTDLPINDGLHTDDFLNWFPVGKVFNGQVICWNEKVEYFGYENK